MIKNNLDTKELCSTIIALIKDKTSINNGVLVEKVHITLKGEENTIIEYMGSLFLVDDKLEMETNCDLEYFINSNGKITSVIIKFS